MLNLEFSIGKNEDHWTVSAKNGTFNLDSERDFFRLFALLDMNFSAANNAISSLSRGIDTTSFPFWKIVAAAIISKSENEAKKALSWVPQLPISDIENLQPYFTDLASAKWATQPTRDVARSYSKRPH